MTYENIIKGIFLNRPNRFIAEVLIEGRKERVHVKNTGRCRELLIPGIEVYLQDCKSPNRKTRFDLITVNKGGKLVNMDSQAPNKAVSEWLKEGSILKPDLIKPEFTYGSSRFDFYFEKGEEKGFIEVKGVTLENEGVASFPDAPTERGLKHLKELIKAVSEGYTACVFFVVQMKNVKYFMPNFENDRAFSEGLIEAYEKGVKILAYDCFVSPAEMKIEDRVNVILRR
ncbi:MAG: DNA/RNA nuclease SfsA [Clostridiales bacterium]|nr:DNA/RNA nuclease SfsA [Clostridiales bacterium]